MKTVQEAARIVLEHSLQWGEDVVPLHESTGRVLREPLLADRDFPPFHRVAMDGIAIRFDAWQVGRRHFSVEGVQAAGAQPLTLTSRHACIEVMTGAVLPSGADTVIPYEQITARTDHEVVVCEIEVKQGQNVHQKGLDRKAGEVIVEAGRLITAAEIGVAATVGMGRLRVAGLPRIAVVATGDELVEVSAEPLPHQIRMSNVHQMAALLHPLKIKAHLLHVSDSRAMMTHQLGQCLAENDVLLLSGGVSKGRFDFVPEVLQDLGTQWAFGKVKQRPGKPFWFGTMLNGTTVFAMPGNPVSTFACMHRYVLPWLRKCLGLDPLPMEYARLATGLSFSAQLTYFLQVALENRNGEMFAVPIQGKGSGDLANLTETDGFLELPEGPNHFQKGDVFRVYRFRPIG